jgi:hypothetical protein
MYSAEAAVGDLMSKEPPPPLSQPRRTVALVARDRAANLMVPKRRVRWWNSITAS